MLKGQPYGNRVAVRGGMTLREVGEELGLTGEAVRLIERRALQKLRAALTKRGYSINDLIEPIYHERFGSEHHIQE